MMMMMFIIVDSTWFVSGKNLARDTFSMLGTNHARTDLCFQDPWTGWIPPSPWYLDCTEGVRGLYQA